MRIFAALELPPRVRREITDWQKPLTVRYPYLKWVNEDHLHLTLRYFGDIPGSVVGEICNILSLWHPPSLEFSLNSVGSFGKRGSPSAFWLGGDFPEELSEIAFQLDRIPDEKGRKGGKKFFPHLTIARRRNSLELPELDLADEIRGVFEESAVINSRLNSSGPEYSFIKRYDLH